MLRSLKLGRLSCLGTRASSHASQTEILHEPTVKVRDWTQITSKCRWYEKCSNRQAHSSERSFHSAPVWVKGINISEPYDDATALDLRVWKVSLFQLVQVWASFAIKQRFPICNVVRCTCFKANDFVQQQGARYALLWVTTSRTPQAFLVFKL